jgi:hypothetical protein
MIYIVVGIGSGLYPALVLSSYIPIKVLKDSNSTQKVAEEQCSESLS